MRTPVQPLKLLVVTIAGWFQRDQQAAIVYLLKEIRVLKKLGCAGGRFASRTTSDIDSR